MAVAPLNEVQRVVNYAVTEIPREKIQLGIPNYGYNWQLPYVRGESKARSLSNVEAVDLARTENASIEFDDIAKSPYFRYFDRPQSYADAVEHVVWFENARSADAKMRLIREYGLGGASVWNIMKYFPALWTVINSLYSIKKI